MTLVSNNGVTKLIQFRISLFQSCLRRSDPPDPSKHHAVITGFQTTLKINKSHTLWHTAEHTSTKIQI